MATIKLLSAADRTASSALLNQTPIEDLQVKDNKDVAKILFLSTNPVHRAHAAEDKCTMCRLIIKFGDAITKKSMNVLKRELKVKAVKLSQLNVTQDQEFCTLESNFADDDNTISPEEEEFLTFTEVLSLMNVPIPFVLNSKLESVLKSKKIPAKKGSDINNLRNVSERNTFLSYTCSKILSDICEMLSLEEVLGMKNVVMECNQHDENVSTLKGSMKILSNIATNVDLPGYKDVIFYYIILIMFKLNLLNRLHTHVLKHLLRRSRDSLPGPEQRTHIESACQKLARYPLTAQPPGICIIFFMTTGRTGSETDYKNVKQLFQETFKYDVYAKCNPTKKNIKDLAEKLNSDRHMFYDSLIVVFMGHGSKSRLQVKGGELHRRTELIQPFAEIEWLQKKPKLFFIQACAERERSKLEADGPATPALAVQSDALSIGISKDDAWNKKYGMYTDGVITNYLADTLVSYATLWYEKASRDEDGSLYINTLIECLKSHGKNTSIENVLRKMHYKVNTVSLRNEDPLSAGNWKQTPYYESSLQKEFIFP